MILTEGKKPEKLLKGSCLLMGRTNKVRLFSLSVQERKTPPYCPRDQESSPRLEVMNEAQKTGRRRQKEKNNCHKQKELHYTCTVLCNCKIKPMPYFFLKSWNSIRSSKKLVNKKFAKFYVKGQPTARGQDTW